MNNYLIMYDISHPRRLAKVSKILLDYGIRVQCSIFEARIYPSELTQMLTRIKKVLKQDEDSFKVFHLCEKCSAKRQAFGRAVAWNQDVPYFIL